MKPRNFQRGLHRQASGRFAWLRRTNPNDTERIASRYADLIRSYLGADYNGTYMPVIDRTEDERYMGDSAMVYANWYWEKHQRGANV